MFKNNPRDHMIVVKYNSRLVFHCRKRLYNIRWNDSLIASINVDLIVKVKHLSNLIPALKCLVNDEIRSHVIYLF